MKTIFAPLRQGCLSICGLLVACSMAVGSLWAQSPAARIASEITSSQVTVLKGSAHPLAQPQYDAGRMAEGTQLTGISIYFNRSAAQEADLKALIAAQQNPASPLYHHWLTPEQFAARFGMAQSDLDSVQSWLQQQGFSIDSVARGRDMIRFSGTVRQVEQAFSTEMHYYQVQGQKHFAPSTNLSVPRALAPVVSGIRNLNDFRPRPLHIRAARRHTKPAYTVSGSTPQDVYFAPGDIATVYDFKTLLSSGTNGTGQSIVIVGQSAIQVSDITDFQSAAGLPTKDPTTILVPNSGTATIFNDGDEGESDLDLEWSGAIAQGASIIFVYTGNSPTADVFDSLTYAIDNDTAPIISSSYGECEIFAKQDGTISALEPYLEKAQTQGQTVIAAAGDDGSTDCYEDTTGVTNPPPVSDLEALSVDYPGSSQYVTSVGGTEVAQTNTAGLSAPSTYWQEASGSSDLISSALAWIPEVVWNDDLIDIQQYGATTLSAGGGGVSTIYTSKPTWQTGVAGIPNDNARDVPDIALYASPDYPGYLYCTSDQSDWQPAGNGYPAQAASCNSGFYDSSSGDLTAAGGTSFAAPIFAGMVAILNQDQGYTTGQGLVNLTLYKLASSSATYGSAFHDVTTGTNDCPSALGPTYCSSTSGGESNYAAGTGYDLASGLGSLDLGNLAGAWPASTAPALVATTTSVSASNSSPNVNTNVTFTITVTANNSTTPTGTISITVDSNSPFTETLTSNGTYTYTTQFTTAGAHQVTASYVAGSTYAASTGSATINVQTVSSGKGTISVAATPSTLTVAQGSSGTETVSVTPAGGYTGTVELGLDFGTSGDNSLQNLCGGFANANSNGEGSVAISGTAAASTTITLDTNASDCASAEAIAKTGMRPMRAFLTHHTANNSGGKNSGGNPVPAGIAFGVLLLSGLLGRHSRRFRNLVSVLALAAAGLALSACGGGVTSTTISNPPKGTYTGTITGTDSATSTITGTTTFTFVID